MKKKLLIVLTAAALLSVSVAGIGGAYAYFTTNAQASGRQTISLGDQTTIEENYGSWQKSVRIKNEDTSSQAVYVRARAFASDDFPVDQNQISGTNWTPEGEWYVYGAPVEPGGYTEILNVPVEGEGKEPREFNVVIVYETTPAVQNGYANGQVQYEPVDWTRTTEEGGQNS